MPATGISVTALHPLKQVVQLIARSLYLNAHTRSSRGEFHLGRKSLARLLQCEDVQRFAPYHIAPCVNHVRRLDDQMRKGPSELVVEPPRRPLMNDGFEAQDAPAAGHGFLEEHIPSRRTAGVGRV